MKHEHFKRLLSLIVVCDGQTLSAEEGGERGQGAWDPEHTPGLDGLPCPSVQVEVLGEVGRKGEGEWIVGIEDVTER